jgi:hypothetical protein
MKNYWSCLERFRKICHRGTEMMSKVKPYELTFNVLCAYVSLWLFLKKENVAG